MSLNHITLLGEVISSPEKRKTLDALTIVTFNISFNLNNENSLNKSSIRVTSIKKIADRVISEIDINDEILLEGRLLTKIVEEKGSKLKIPYIQLSNFYIVKKRNNIEELKYDFQKEDEENINDEEIPF